MAGFLVFLKLYSFILSFICHSFIYPAVYLFSLDVGRRWEGIVYRGNSMWSVWRHEIVWWTQHKASRSVVWALECKMIRGGRCGWKGMLSATLWKKYCLYVKEDRPMSSPFKTGYTWEKLHKEQNQPLTFMFLFQVLEREGQWASSGHWLKVDQLSGDSDLMYWLPWSIPVRNARIWGLRCKLLMSAEVASI